MSYAGIRGASWSRSYRLQLVVAVALLSPTTATAYAQAKAADRRAGASDPIVAQILRHADPRFVLGARVALPPRTAHGPRERLGLWVYIRVRGAGRGPAMNESLWEANLVIGAVHDAMQRARAGTVMGSTTTVVDNGGHVIGRFGSAMMGTGAASVHDDSATAIVASIRTRANAAGLRVIRVHASRPLGVAISVTATTSHPSAFITATGRTALVEHIFSAPRSYDGFYLRVVDSMGRLVLIQDVATRVGAGDLWYRGMKRP